MFSEYFFYINKRRIPGSSDDEYRSGRDDAERRPSPTAMMKFRTVDETVNAMKIELFTQEACLTRWNQNAEQFVLSHFGTGKFAPPPGFAAEVVAKVEEWLGKNKNFWLSDDGQWVWGVLD